MTAAPQGDVFLHAQNPAPRRAAVWTPFAGNPAEDRFERHLFIAHDRPEGKKPGLLARALETFMHYHL